MAETIVTDYLLELSEALSDLPREVRVEIIAGVREELDGLSAEDAEARIRELGDPAFIAAAARDEVPPPQPESKALPTAAAILVMVGGLIIPIAGWVVGIVLMWMSRAFTVRSKIVVTLLPTVVTVITVAVIGAVVVASRAAEDDGFHGPSLDAFANPLIPAFYDYFHSSIFTLPVVAFATGVWLLVKARKS